MRLVTPFLAAFAMLASATAGAEPFVSRELGFQVEFPAPPTIRQGVVKTQFGAARLTRFLASRSFVRAVLNVLRYDHEPFTDEEARALLKKSLAAQLSPSEVTLIEQRDITLGKHPGMEAVVAVKRGTRRAYYRQRIYFIGDRKFLLSVIGVTKAHVMAPESTRFFESFMAW